ncbi:hypothetical protein B0H13DRAFT_2038798, partial [Mycena leptocephala]
MTTTLIFTLLPCVSLFPLIVYRLLRSLSYFILPAFLLILTMLLLRILVDAFPARDALPRASPHGLARTAIQSPTYPRRMGL